MNTGQCRKEKASLVKGDRDLEEELVMVECRELGRHNGVCQSRREKCDVRKREGIPECTKMKGTMKFPEG